MYRKKMHKRYWLGSLKKRYLKNLGRRLILNKYLKNRVGRSGLDSFASG
jgi:hypothetical protein